MSIANILHLMGGVALFLFGMGLMGDSLKLVAGPKLELVLYNLTNTALKGLLLGTVVTAVVQSSSAISAMVVGFVNSGIMNLSQAIGIILGANVGTSVTGWILCLSYIGGGGGALSLLSSTTIAALVALLGILLRMTGKDAQKKHTGEILLGFAVLMYGMQSMSDAVSPLRQSEAFLHMMTMFEHPLLGILIGALVTAVLQSNSASVGILQALSATGAITFASSFPMLMGMGIGAAVPVLLSAIGANRDGRRVSLFYLYTGVFGTVIVSAVFYTINAVNRLPVMDTVMSPFSIALVNTLFRVGSILILCPFLRQLEALSGKMIPEKTAPEKYNELTAGIERLEERFLLHPALAIEQSRVAINSMALRAQDGLAASFELLRHFDKKAFQAVAEMEDAVDTYEDALGTYLMKISSQNISERQSEDVSKYLHSISDFERISDHSLNLAELAQELYDKNITFSSAALNELQTLRTAVGEIVSIAVSAFITNDLDLAARVEPLEEVIDGLCDEMKLHHINRLQDGSCTLGQGYVFNDLLTNFERVADHCSNIAVAMIEIESDSFDTHEYLESVREMKSEKYQHYLDEYSKKFSI
ncbi:MAG: Na/Pi cotransporter family protein [Oscillospiraceae bacterium]|nr:Na/Pi cotransporter family protein [Oscillospiraceae bacterium]